jgi:hypothetical protein
MAKVVELSDWGLEDELALELPVVVVGLMSRLDPVHIPFRLEFAALAERYDASVAFRLLDLSENPALILKLKVHRLPAVVVYSGGAERGRWETAELPRVESAVDALIRSQEGIE